MSNPTTSDAPSHPGATEPSSLQVPPPAAAAASDTATTATSFQVGQTVTVAARTWAGINELGGVGRITDIRWVRVEDDEGDDENESEEGDKSSSNKEKTDGNNNAAASASGGKQRWREVACVRYVLDNRHERDVDVARYVRPHQSLSRLRSRGMMMGRCTSCGSLRVDCGSCDFRQVGEEQLSHHQRGRGRRSQPGQATTKQNKPKKKKDRNGQGKKYPSFVDFLLSSSSSSSSGSSSSSSSSEEDDNIGSKLENIQRVLEKRKRQDKMYRRFKLKSTATNSSQSKSKRRLPLEQPSSCLMRLEDSDSDSGSGSGIERINQRTTGKRSDVEAKLHRGDGDGGGKKAQQQGRSASVISGRPTLLDLGLSSSSSESDGDDPESCLPFQQLLLSQSASSARKKRNENKSPYSSNNRLSLRRRLQKRRVVVPPRKRFRLPSKPTQPQNQPSDEKNSKDGALSVSSPGTVEGSSDSEQEIGTNNRKIKGKAHSLSLVDGSSQPIWGNDEESGDYNYDDAGDEPHHHQQHLSPIAADEDAQQNVENDDFIQPEGNAQRLPSDVRDRTSKLSYEELGPFFDEWVEQLQMTDIPNAKAKVVAQERKWKEIAADGNSTRENKIRWLQDCEDLHESLVNDLVRDGLDQCEAALRKLSDTRLHKQHKASGPERKVDIRGFQLDAVDDAVQGVVRSVLGLVELGARGIGALDDDTSFDGNESDDGWAVPASQSPVRDDVGESQRNFLSPQTLPEFDPHSHANRRRKGSKIARSSSERLHDHQSKASKHGNARMKGRREAVSLNQQEDGSDSSTRAESLHLGKSRPKKRRKRRAVHKVRSKDSESPDRARRASSTKPATSLAGGPEGVATSEPSSSDGNHYHSFDEDSDERNGDVTTERREMGGRPVRGTRKRPADESALIEERLFTVEGPASLDATRGFDRGVRGNALDAVTRMERFLDANKDNESSAASSPSICPIPKPSRKSLGPGRRSASARREGGEDGPRRSSSFSPEPRFEGFADHDLQEALFSSLGDRQVIEDVGSDDPEESRDSSSLSDLCSVLAERFPGSCCVRIVKRIIARFKRDSGFDDRENVSLVFGTFVKVLRSHGSETLMAVVSREGSNIRPYSHLYAAALQMLAMGLNQRLEPDDGVTHRIFSPGSCERFIELVLLQLVDVVYAVVHPAAWALRDENPGRILDDFEPLRAALGHHLHLSEAVCRCLLSELESQRWQVTSDNQHAYVSSFSPVVWSAYLASGSPPKKPPAQNVRLAAFKGGFPRCEVDALWSLLAYFSSSKATTSDERRTNFWNLVTRLFARSIVPSDNDDSCGLPPCTQQLTATSLELRNLKRMLEAGTTGTIPRNDTIPANIIRSSLLLQGDDFHHNEDSRLAIFPTLRSEKGDKKLIKLFWEKALSSSFPASTTTSPSGLLDLAKHTDRGNEVSASFAQPCLLPTSTIGLTCIGLMSAWIARVPTREARHGRLASAIKTLINQLIADSSGSIDQNPEAVGTSDAFANAFALPSNRGQVGTGPVRRELVLREAAAFLAILAKVGLGHQAGSSKDTALELGETVWELIADDAMKIRRQELIGEGSLPQDKYNSDSLRLYLAAKAITSVSLLFLGIPPWAENLLYPSTFSLFLPQNDGSSNETLLFLYSSLSSCLDYARDSSEVVTSIASFMGILLSRVRQLLLDDNPEISQLKPSIQHFRDAVLDLTIPPFCRCLQAVTSAACCAGEDDFRVASLLSLLRSALLVAKSAASTEVGGRSGGSAPPAGNEDLWGGLDDDVFARLDIPGDGAQSPSEARQSLDSIWEFLNGAVEQAKPSTRFVIVQHAPGASGMSSQGKTLIGRHIGAVAATLAAIAAFEGGSRTDWLVSRFISAANDGSLSAKESDDDSLYRKTVAQCISHELVSKAHSSGHVLNYLKSKPEPFVFTLFDQFLEISLLLKLPSCNLSRIRERSGKSGEKKEFASLIKLAEGGKEAVNKLWSSCSSLGRILRKEGHWGLSDCLQRNDPDLPEFRHALVNFSLEEECLNRFRLFRRVCSWSGVDGHQLFVLVFISSSIQLGKLQEMICNQERSQLGTSQTMSHRTAKLLELCSCYVEFHLSLISRIFRGLSKTGFDSVRLLWSRVCKSYLSPMVRKEALDIRAAAQRIVSPAASADDASHMPPDLPNISKMCFDAVYRRLKDFIVCIAREFARNGGAADPGAFFLLLLSEGVKGTDENARDFSRAFTCNETFYEPDQEKPALLSPLYAEIKNYLADVDGACPLDADDGLALLKLKRFAVESILIPRLCHAATKKSEKRGIIRLLTHMLHLERREDAFVDSTASRLHPRSLCSLAQGVRISVQATLSDRTVDDALTDLAFQCGKAAANLPTACVDKRGVGWLIDWSYCVVRGDSSDHSVELAYLWSFFCWLRAVGDTVQEGSRKVEDLRTEMKSLTVGSKEIVASAQTGEMSSLKRCWRTMVLLESQVLGSNISGSSSTTNINNSRVRNITNVYSSSSTNRSSGGNKGEDVSESSDATWAPPASVRGSALAFVMRVRQAEVDPR